MPGGSKSTTGSMNSRHFNPINTFQMFILYNISPKHWQSYLQCDKFIITVQSADDFFDKMECCQLADQLNPLLKQQNQSKTDKDDSKKSTEKFKNGCVHFNLTCSSLKGEALCVFNDKAVEQKEETKDTHVKCLCAVHHRSTFFYPHKILFEIHRVFGFFCFRILIFTDFIQSPIIFFWQRDLANPRPATDFPSPVP
jgi:hypothetical protein